MAMLGCKLGVFDPSIFIRAHERMLNNKQAIIH
jgi:hypothetical protein